MIRRILLAGAAGTLAAATAGAAPAAAEAKQMIHVRAGCSAPAPGTSNFCSLRGTLPGAGLDGADITWEVTLFTDGSAWRVQSQAFSEAGVECQYPLRWYGELVASGARERVVTDSSVVSGFSVADNPTLGLTVDQVRIEPTPTC